MTNRFFFSLLACAWLASCTGGLSSSGSVARIKKATGPVGIEREGRIRWVGDAGMPDNLSLRDAWVFDKDILVTGSNASAQIDFRGLGLLRLDAGTRLGLRGMEDMQHALFDLESGGLMAVINPFLKKENLEIRTPSVVAAVTGGAFRIWVRGDKTRLSVLTGSVSLKNQRGAVALVMETNECAASQSKLSALRPLDASVKKEFEALLSQAGAIKLKEYPLMTTNLNATNAAIPKQSAESPDPDESLWSDFEKK